MSDNETVPSEWLEDIRNAIQHPEQFKYAGWGEGDNRIKSVREANAIIPSQLIFHFDRFHSRAIAHAKTKGQHEAASLLNYYIIWKFFLWRAEYESWDEYIRDMVSIPFSFGATKIKMSVIYIDKFVERGMEFDNIIKIMGEQPTAAKMLTDVPDEQLPGGDINSAATMLLPLGPSEAIASVNDWTGKQTYHALSAIHDAAQERLYLEVKRTGISGAWDRMDWKVDMIDADAAAWFMERCGVRTERRVFK